jgi:hypothetical protein
MRLACHFERQFMALLGLIAMILPAAAQPAVISVTGGTGVVISPDLYGINYVWDKVPGFEFSSFLSSLTGVTHYTLARYPGGWNAERLDWAHNVETRGAPSAPGIDAAEFLAAVPLATFITPSHTAVSNPQNIGEVVNRSVRLVEQYGAQVQVWEIGNEWWLQTGASKNSNKYAMNLENYGLLLGAVVPAMKAANPSIKIYATGDWRSPESFASMRAAAGPQAWSQIDGISLHIYCGVLDPATMCSNIGESLAQIRQITGKQAIYVSEWAAPARQNPGDTGIRNAAYTMGLLQDLAYAGVQMAAYWPPVKNVPAMALVADDYSDGYATGYLFGWMAQYYRGTALRVSGPLRAVAAQNAGTVAVMVAAGAAPEPDVRVALQGLDVHNVVSAQVMYNPAGGDGEGKQVGFATLPVSLRSGADGVQYIDFSLNPGTAGRGSGYEIAKIILN